MEEKGVWRTIKGRRVFIREGEDLASAMKRSGKFDNLNNKPRTISKEEYENPREAVNYYLKKGEFSKADQYMKDYGLEDEKEMFLEGQNYKVQADYNKYLNSKKEFHYAGEELYSDDPNRFGDKMRKYNEKMNPSKEIHVPYEKYGGGYTGEKTTADYYTTKEYTEDENGVNVLMPHKLLVTKKQLEGWTGTSINKMKAGDIVKVPYTMSGTYDDKNMYEHKLIKGGDYPEIETKIPLLMTKEQAERFEKNYQNLASKERKVASDRQHTALSKMSLSELRKTAQEYNIDTTGLSKQKLMAKLIAIFK